jgi:hypothetical protein
MTTATLAESSYAASGLDVAYPEDPIRILVTGWRAWPLAQRQFIWDELDSLWQKFGLAWQRDKLIIIHGQCPYGGVDLHAENWTQARQQRWERHPAERRGGRLLGPERNAKMVSLGARLCIGFPGPGSRGTWDCLEKATNAGIETYSKSWFEAAKVAPQPPLEEQLHAF